MIKIEAVKERNATVRHVSGRLDNPASHFNAAFKMPEAGLVTLVLRLWRIEIYPQCRVADSLSARQEIESEGGRGLIRGLGGASSVLEAAVTCLS